MGSGFLPGDGSAAHRVACLVLGWGPSRLAGLPDSDACERVGGLGAPESGTRSQWDRLLAKCVGCGEAASVALRVRDHPDDGVQPDVAWHPGQLPNLPAISDPVRV